MTFEEELYMIAYKEGYYKLLKKFRQLLINLLL